jgi:transketolase
MADVATVLFARFLKFDPARPDWPDRDRFVLSAGHGSMLLYALLYLTGYPDMTIDDLRRFRQLESRTPGHPEYGLTPGVETTTGPLGQGLANAVGMALAERLLQARYGAEVVDHYTYVLASDGDLMEGVSHEAASLAGHLGLGKLIVLFDDNHVSIDGPTELAVSDDALARFRAYGWEARAVYGHDAEAVAGAIAAARRSPTPSLIACHTTIGYGAPTKAGTAATHGAPLGAEEVAGARVHLGWPHPPFVVPEHIVSAWRAVGARGGADSAAWDAALARLDPALSAEFERTQRGELPPGWDAAIVGLKRQFAEERPAWATRKASQAALEALCAAVPEMVGGSADLTGSNNTKTQDMALVTAADFSGRYIHYGVREHAMVGVMSGLALHRGVIPYGGSFLIFTDYCRPAIRLAAISGLRVIYVMTHDSIGLGEDGPTHQPVEHLASLRAMPNLNVFRPADAVETAECWALALQNDKTPSIMALTRQGLPTLRTEHRADNPCARGGYVLRESAKGADARKVTLIATGSEVEIACAARETLEAAGTPTAVVSMPCFELFDAQDEDYRVSVLGQGTVRVGAEAAVRQGWDAYLRNHGGFVGMKSFGASAPIGPLYEHFGITAEAIVREASKRL